MVSLSNKLLAVGDVSCDMPQSVATMMMQLRQIFEKLELHLSSYAEVVVVESTKKFAWIPEHLYKKGGERQYLQLVCKLDNKDEIKVDYSERMQAYCVFVTTNAMVPALKILAPKMKHRCQHSVLAESQHLAAKSKTKPLMALNVREGFVDLAVFVEQKLLMANTYPCTSMAEALYIAISVSRNMQLRNEQMEICLSGQVDRDWYQSISPYFGTASLNTGRPLAIDEMGLRKVHIYKYILTLG